MKYLLTFFLNIFIIFQVYSNENQIIQFHRSSIINKLQKYSIYTSTSTTTTTEFSQISKQNSVSSIKTLVKLDGLLKVLKINNKGLATNLNFKINNFYGKINDQIINTTFPGKTLLINLTTKPICEFSFKSSKNPISSNEIQLLSLIFKPSSEFSLADYIHTNKPVSIGDSWTPNYKPFISFFNQLGIKINKNQIHGSVLLKKRTNYNNIDCWEIQEKINISNINNINFSFFLSVLLPINPKFGEALKIIKKSHFQIIKTPKGNSFMTSGIKKISLKFNEVNTITRK
jgi:hypothetical protein